MSFADLLRRSRFASFDPHIRQAYGAPPSHVSRGNWGLKRPVAAKRKNGFISLANYEEHEQYIDWHTAEAQVRFIRRIDELNVAPVTVPGSPWYQGLGPAAVSRDSQMDSEFCPGETGLGLSGVPSHSNESVVPAVNVPVPVPVDLESSGFGSRGTGEYGIHATQTAVAIEEPIASRSMPSKPTPSKGAVNLQPNIHAMSPRVFTRYLEKLRQLRPQFEEYVSTTVTSASTSGAEHPITMENLDGLTRSTTHMRFLGEYAQSQYSPEPTAEPTDELTPKKPAAPTLLPPSSIRQQPHRFGGLSYYKPTDLETRFLSRNQPTLVLHQKLHDEDLNEISRRASKDSGYVASFGGLTASIPHEYAGSNTHHLMEPKSDRLQFHNHISIPGETTEDALAASTTSELDQTFTKATKMTRAYALELETPPRSVGRITSPRQLTRVRIETKLATKEAIDAALVADAKNPRKAARMTTLTEGDLDGHSNYAPGTMEYYAEMPPSMVRRNAGLDASGRATVVTAFMGSQLARSQWAHKLNQAEGMAASRGTSALDVASLNRYGMALTKKRTPADPLATLNAMAAQFRAAKAPAAAPAKPAPTPEQQEQQEEKDGEK